MYQYKIIFYRGDILSTIWKVLAVMGLTGGALIIYSMQNPECMNNMKNAIDNMTKKASKQSKNMMEQSS